MAVEEDSLPFEDKTPYMDIRTLHVDAIAILLRKHKRPFKCYFCRKRITKPPATDPRRSDEQTEPLNLIAHHIDNHHENLDPENIAPAHVICHNEHHRTPEGQDGRKRMQKRIRRQERTEAALQNIRTHT
jgi:hypothetical protein